MEKLILNEIKLEHGATLLETKQNGKFSIMKGEVIASLFFLVESDIRIFGKIRSGTVEAFTMQQVKFPEDLKKYLSDETTNADS